ncbi:hypothetical protein ASE01_02055 [Nocardioides sp. Root190]|nr:hypothetical protein ASE01_02055 [Nocardioides sp. Root190]
MFHVGTAYDFQPRPAAVLFADATAVVLAEMAAIHSSAGSRRLALEFEVVELLKDEQPSLVHDGSVHVSVPRGPVMSTKGEPAHSIEDFETWLPEGTTVALFLGPAAVDQARPSALPEGARLSVVGLQGAFVDDCGRLEYEDGPPSDWTDVSGFEEFADRLRRLG